MDNPFGTPNKFLSDNGGEFISDEFVSMCENLNIRICTTAAYSPWSNGLVERHNAILGLTVSKILDDTECDLNVAVAWAVSAKNSLRNVHGYSPNQLVFGKNPNFPNIIDNEVPALEGLTSSEIVEQNLNAMHSARRNYIENESSNKIRKALKSQTRSYADINYMTGDRVYFKRPNSNCWKGPGTVIGRDGQQILVKQSSNYVRVHPCNLQHIKESEITNVELNVINQNPESDIDEISSKSNCTTSLDEDYEDESPEVRSVQDNLEIETEANENESVVNNENENESEEALSVQNNSGILQVYSDNSVKPKIKQHIKYKLIDSNDMSESQIINRAGKSGGKYSNWYNVKDRKTEKLSSINWDNVERWQPCNESDDVLYNVNFEPTSLSKAKLQELESWRDNDVYHRVKYDNQKLISLRWVNTNKTVNGINKVKSRLVARGVQEQENIQSDSPTCSKESIRIILNIIATLQWDVKSIDITSAFLQSNDINRDVFVKPPKESGEDTDIVWKLKKTVYGLGDAARAWYLSVKEKLLKLGAKPSSYDPAVFRWHHEETLAGVICIHVDDFLFGGNDMFIENVVNPLSQSFVIGTEHENAFKYLGVDIKQEDRK